MNIDNKNEEREIIKAAKKQNKRLLSEKIKEERKPFITLEIILVKYQYLLSNGQ